MRSKIFPHCDCKGQAKPGTMLEDKSFEKWSRFLPADWRNAVDEPLYFKNYREYEISARRSVGYDADDRPCFTAHSFQLPRPASDDDEEFYEVITRNEEMAAWRLRDERWLIFRISSNEQCSQPRGFYTISPDMPR